MIPESFFDRVTKTETCWLWHGATTKKGYGRWRRRPAHRVLWEEENGPVPAGLEMDHLCRVHNCVRPSHLEAVTRRVNALRGRSHNKEKVYCKHGHELNQENVRLVFRKRTNGFERKCLPCTREQQNYRRKVYGR